MAPAIPANRGPILFSSAARFAKLHHGMRTVLTPGIAASNG